MNYPMYVNNSQYYMQNLQDMKDRIDAQMRQIQQNQVQQQAQVPQIHQSFQLAPNTNTNEIQAKYVTDINDVKNTFVMTLGLFLDKDMQTLWVKNINGDIRTFSLNEIIEEDPKDIEIRNLKQEIESMKGMIKNESVNANVNEQITNEKSNRVQPRKSGNTK